MRNVSPFHEKDFELLRNALGSHYEMAEFLFNEFGPTWSIMVFAAFYLAHHQNKIEEIVDCLGMYYYNYYLYNAPIDNNSEDPWTAEIFYDIFTKVLTLPAGKGWQQLP